MVVAEDQSLEAQSVVVDRVVVADQVEEVVHLMVPQEEEEHVNDQVVQVGEGVELLVVPVEVLMVLVVVEEEVGYHLARTF